MIVLFNYLLQYLKKNTLVKLQIKKGTFGNCIWQEVCRQRIWAQSTPGAFIM